METVIAFVKLYSEALVVSEVHMNKFVSLISLCTIITFGSPAFSQSQAVSQFNSWHNINAKVPTSQAVNSRVSTGHQLSTDIAQLRKLLLGSNDYFVISLPLPDGRFVDFSIALSSVVAQQLTDNYPEIRTFSGYQINNPQNNGRFDISPQGFHGMFHYGDKVVFIDPKYRHNNEQYISYFRKDSLHLSDKALLKQLPPKKKSINFEPKYRFNSEMTTTQNQTSLKTYRLAISATGEYTQFHQGTKASALAALITLVNRLNDVYQRDLAIKLELVANNDAIIYTDPATDPFSNTDTDGEINTEVINKAIGSNSYDIGHVVNTNGGGLAGFGVVCDSVSKGDGVTGDRNPTGDVFNIDYVAHEIGHQFMADHTFNGSGGACEGNRVGESAYEPGSASTIMGYAGICGSQNMQNNSDPYFHTHSIDQIKNFTTTGTGKTCGSVSTSTNNIPVVDAGNDYTIPARTPFILKGSATDEDSEDILSYSWEQYNLGESSKSAADQIDDGNRPLFRTWSPISKASRTLPRLADIVANKITIGETYATTTRALNFRLLVRDNRGGVSFDSMKINVIDKSETFAVTSPTSGITWSGNKQWVSWNVAGSDSSPISCSSVNIELSTNGGMDFDQSLASQIANNGSAEVTIPNGYSNQSRVRVSCADNIFFAINQGDFIINTSDSDNSEKIIISGQQDIIIDEDASIEITTDMFTYENTSADKISVLPGANYQTDGVKVIPESNFNGLLMVTVKASQGADVSTEYVVKAMVAAINDVPVTNADDFFVIQGSVNNVFDILANDSDIDQGDILIIKGFNYNGSGSVSIVDNKLSYTPSTNYSGAETLTYTVSDTGQAESTATVNISVSPSSNTPNVNNDGENSSASSGGSMYWLFALSWLVFSCRHINGYRQIS